MGLTINYHNPCRQLICISVPDHFVLLQVWNLTNCRLKINHNGHSGYLNTVTVSPDGSLCASGGKVEKISNLYIYIYMTMY